MKEWNNVPEDITPYEGFVYIITDGKKYYIGKKSFWSRKKVRKSVKLTKAQTQTLNKCEDNLKNSKSIRLNSFKPRRVSDAEKKCLQILKNCKDNIKEDNQGKRKVCTRIKIESDWKEYWGSSDKFKEYVEKEGKEVFQRCVTRLCETKSELSYQELLKQIEYDVLNDSNSFNGILNVRLNRTK